MLGGFNHNFRYNGKLFHVQTEDGGFKSPRIVTQLFYGGTVLASAKQNYEEIIHEDDLKRQVESRMQEQHKDILRRLRNGEYDEIISRLVKDPSPRNGTSDLDGLSAETTEPSSSPDQPLVDLDELVFAYLAGNDRRYQVQ